MLRSIASIILSFIITSVFIRAFANVAIKIIGLEEGALATTDSWLILDLVIRFIAAITGGYAAARIAGRKEVPHAVALGILLTIISIGIIVAMPNEHPIWFHIGNVLVFLPATYLGGKMRLAKRKVDETSGTVGTDI